MSKPITIALGHDLGADEARRRIAAGLEALRAQFADKIGSASVRWTGYKADVEVTALGQTAAATVNVGADVVTIELRLPLLLAAFGQRIRAAVEKSGSDALLLPPRR